MSFFLLLELAAQPVRLINRQPLPLRIGGCAESYGGVVVIGLMTQMANSVTSLLTARNTLVNKSAGDRRRIALRMRQVLGDGRMTAQGFPKPLMCWLGVQVLDTEAQPKDSDIYRD